MVWGVNNDNKTKKELSFKKIRPTIEQLLIFILFIGLISFLISLKKHILK